MKRYAELAGNCKRQRIKSLCDNKLGYRGEFIVALHNDTDSTQTIAPSERIAQLVISPVMEAWFNKVDELEETERGEGGFGSSGRL